MQSDVDLGNFEARSRIESLFNDARTVPEPFFYGMAAHIVLLNKVSLGCAGVMVDVFEGMVCVTWHPHECQGPGFPSRISYCSMTIRVTYFNCQGFSYSS